MNEKIRYLGDKVRTLLKNSRDDRRIIIGICGVPGSGKTTLAAQVVANLNTSSMRSANEPPLAVAVPMDGYHYSRAQLSAMADPKEAHHRRGAAFTFDADGFLKLIRSLARAEVDETVYAPSFDHATKDPVADAIFVPPGTRVVVIEGIYCGLNRPPWSDAARLMSEVWYVDCPREVAHTRLARRHLASGIVRDELEAWARATGTDELNAEDLRRNLLPVQEKVSVAELVRLS